MSLPDGARLGSYEILSALGAGGMGEVYRARDTRLDRLVAIKILPQAFAADAERVARFRREAKVLASLNHPHIAAIYGLEEADGVKALVMELVDGEDLSQRVSRGPLPLDEALPIARQIAEALEAAHEQGIIHRDLKPANIRIRPDGTVKVLDFGLAQALVSDAGSPDILNSPTITAPTRDGIVLGTAPYMSPEQASGRPVDRRTDIWGDDGTIIVSSLDRNIGLKRVSANGGEVTELTKPTTDPQIAPSMLPGGRGVLFTIWGSTPENRQLMVLDLKSGEQKALLRGGGSPEYLDTGHLVHATVDERSGSVSGTLWAVGFDLDRLALAGEPVRVNDTLAVDMFADYAVSKTGTLAYLPSRAVSRSFVWVDRTGRETPIDGLPPRPYATVSLSPDGKRAAFDVSDQEFDIWAWDFARESATRLTFEPGYDGLPRWSPDGRQIVFQSDRDGGLTLHRVAADGSGPVENMTIRTPPSGSTSPYLGAGPVPAFGSGADL